MKKCCLIIIMFSLCTNVFGYSTEASKFAEKQYQTHNSCKVNINSKKEYKLEYQQPIGQTSITDIIYGHGDMKIRGKSRGKFLKKYRISYIVLLNCNYKPIWSSIYFFEK